MPGMARLRRTHCAGPGFRRRRHGDGWTYVDTTGEPIADLEVIARIDGLVIPPAWTDVWICPFPNGHIQATGTDGRGRRQYRYHDQWRRMRDEAKFDRVLDFAEALPEARARIRHDLALRGLVRDRVLACAARLLDLGFFRIGSEQYAEHNNTFGLATMRRDHVTVSRNGVITFDYTAKSGKRRVQSVADEAVLDVVRSLRRRRGGGPELLAYRSADRWVDIKSADINTYLRDVTSGDYSAKDFRTWNATVLAAVALAVSTDAALTPTARQRAVTRAVKEVAEYLGNTPAVCRSSYIDPRVIDRYEDGVTIAEDLERLGDGATFGQLATQGEIEGAVLAMLREPVSTRRKAG